MNEIEYIPTVETDENGAPLPQALAEAVYHVLDAKNADDVSVVKVDKKTDLTDYFVFCTARSTTHARALSDELEYKLGLAGVKPDRAEGRGNGNTWLVLDYGCVIVHVFTRDARAFYDLDRLYSDAEKIDIRSHIE